MAYNMKLSTETVIFHTGALSLSLRHTQKAVPSSCWGFSSASLYINTAWASRQTQNTSSTAASPLQLSAFSGERFGSESTQGKTCYSVVMFTFPVSVFFLCQFTEINLDKHINTLRVLFVCKMLTCCNFPLDACIPPCDSLWCTVSR